MRTILDLSLTMVLCNILGRWALFPGDNDVPIKRVWYPIYVKALDGSNRWSSGLNRSIMKLYTQFVVDLDNKPSDFLLDQSNQ